MPDSFYLFRPDTPQVQATYILCREHSLSQKHQLIIRNVEQAAEFKPHGFEVRDLRDALPRMPLIFQYCEYYDSFCIS